MSKTAGPLEKQLVSLAGTLLHLNKIQAVINNKPIVPRHMEAAMQTVSAEMVNLEASFLRVKEETQKIAAPVLEEWFAALGKSVGAGFESKCELRSGTVVKVSGRVHSLELHPGLIDTWRAVRVRLYPFDLDVNGHRTESADAAYMACHDGFVRDHIGDAKLSDGGREVGGLVVYMPIQQKVRDDNARASRYRGTVTF